MREKTRFPCPICLSMITGWTEEDSDLTSVWAMSLGQGKAIPCGHSVDDMYDEWQKSMREKVMVAAELEVERGYGFSGSLQEFNQWRVYLAEIAGYELKEDVPGFPTPVLDWERFTDEQCFGNWEYGKYPEDPLIMLLIHFDYCGFIAPNEARMIHKRLNDLLPKMNEDMARVTSSFMHGLEHGFVLGDSVEFDCLIYDQIAQYL